MSLRPLLVALSMLGLVAAPLAAQEPEVPEGEIDLSDLIPEGANPYAAPKDYDAEELVRYLGRMMRKPKTIRHRAEFVDAVAEAAERALADEELKDESRSTAALTLFDVLHRGASLGDKDADKRLMDWAAKLKDSPRDDVREAAALHLLEQRVMAAREEGLEQEQALKLLEELKEYFTSQKKLTRRHLRLASETIGVINSLEAEGRDERFDEFGKLFAKSDDPDLARYGRMISKKPEKSGGVAELVGKPLELEGQTVDGLAFDWESYRGKVVLVDFWATWCGPCRAELPNVKAAYEEYGDLGFDVVGVSLDTDKEALDEYLREQAIPWTNLFDEENAGWGHPMAKKYGVRAIPTTILVGKDGKVLTTGLRGAALGAYLKKHLKGE